MARGVERFAGHCNNLRARDYSGSTKMEAVGMVRNRQRRWSLENRLVDWMQVGGEKRGAKDDVWPKQPGRAAAALNSDGDGRKVRPTTGQCHLHHLFPCTKASLLSESKPQILTTVFKGPHNQALIFWTLSNSLTAVGHVCPLC